MCLDNASLNQLIYSSISALRIIGAEIMSEKLTVAVVLSLLGSVFVIVAGLLVAVVARVGVGVVGLMCGIFMIASAIMMSNGEPG
ncbi:MAG: hypothetical protein QXF04_01940 [Candidatus Aenigmatarchaeota archaeon]